MERIINIYFDRKLAALTAKKDEDIIAIKVTDANYKTLRELKKAKDSKCANLISLGNYKFSDAINEKVAEVRKTYNKAVKDLNALVDEVYARLEIASTYDEKMAVLNSYGIVKKNKINA